VDPERAARPAADYHCLAEIEEAVAKVLGPLRREIGYI
jgi:hypothetical protein